MESGRWGCPPPTPTFRSAIVIEYPIEIIITAISENVSLKKQTMPPPPHPKNKNKNNPKQKNKTTKHQQNKQPNKNTTHTKIPKNWKKKKIQNRTKNIAINFLLFIIDQYTPTSVSENRLPKSALFFIYFINPHCGAYTGTTK